MGAKGEAFATEFEAKAKEATALLEKLTDADWRKTTAAEKWPIAVTAHHIASSYEPATHIIRTIAAGQALPHFTREVLDDGTWNMSVGFEQLPPLALHDRPHPRLPQDGPPEVVVIDEGGHDEDIDQRCMEE